MAYVSTWYKYETHTFSEFSYQNWEKAKTFYVFGIKSVKISPFSHAYIQYGQLIFQIKFINNSRRHVFMQNCLRNSMVSLFLRCWYILFLKNRCFVPYPPTRWTKSVVLVRSYLINVVQPYFILKMCILLMYIQLIHV